jgi:hypothetical protein
VPADSVVVVRGDDLDPDTARTQAITFRRRFPDWDRWGLSAFYARSDLEIDDLAADQLERFPKLIVLDLRALSQAHFEVVPTFRSPHVTIAFRGDLDKGLRRLAVLRTDVRTNPYHEHEPG